VYLECFIASIAHATVEAAIWIHYIRILPNQRAYSLSTFWRFFIVCYTS